MQASIVKCFLFLFAFLQWYHTVTGLQLVQYWGQNSATAANGDKSAQKPLSYYCQDNTQDILVISFAHQFGTGQEMAFDLSTESDRCKGLIQGTQLLDCPQMETDIQTCQKNGKKVLLSLGGASGSYGLTSAKDGATWADHFWDTFGNSHGKNRPFGKAVVDGFDLDIEAGSVEGYTSFVDTMRQHYNKDSSKTYYISGAPQCPFPDAWLGDALDHAWFDFVWVQFYNNYCKVEGGQFNYDTWENWAKTKSKNKQVKIFLGIPASPSAAGSGYVPADTLTKTIHSLKSSSHFGGVMMWDASQAYSQKINFAKQVSQILHSGSAADVDDDEGNGGTSMTAPKNRPSSTRHRHATPTTATSRRKKHRHRTKGVPTRTSKHGKPTASHSPTKGKGKGKGASNGKKGNQPKKGGPCGANDTFTCIGDGFAQCSQGKWLVRPCGGSMKCKSVSNGLVTCG